MTGDQYKRLFFKAMDESRDAGEINDFLYRSITQAADELGEDSWIRLGEFMRKAAWAE